MTFCNNYCTDNNVVLVSLKNKTEEDKKNTRKIRLKKQFFGIFLVYFFKKRNRGSYENRI